jgi:hypothetical protein
MLNLTRLASNDIVQSIFEERGLLFRAIVQRIVDPFQEIEMRWSSVDDVYYYSNESEFRFQRDYQQQDAW